MTPNENPGPGRPPFPEGKVADVQIQLRVRRVRKAAYVHAANVNKQTLAAWMFEICDKAASYKPE